VIDGTIALREGEQVDAGALLAWLARALPELVPAGSRLLIRQFPAGFSNLTYLVTIEPEHEHGRRALVLRRPPRGVKTGVAHDMGREHGILTALHPSGVPVPCVSM
jgi:aminoglycoside phosphotransferase (APT) family kinase protein